LIAWAVFGRALLSFKYQVIFDREPDGRWIAEVVGLPGVLAYGNSKAEAFQAASGLALRVLADKVEGSEPSGETRNLEFSFTCA
jgi:predicted RNase H-like HicB family nuclease